MNINRSVRWAMSIAMLAVVATACGGGETDDAAPESAPVEVAAEATPSTDEPDAAEETPPSPTEDDGAAADEAEDEAPIGPVVPYLQQVLADTDAAIAEGWRLDGERWVIDLLPSPITVRLLDELVLTEAGRDLVRFTDPTGAASLSLAAPDAVFSPDEGGFTAFTDTSLDGIATQDFATISASGGDHGISWWDVTFDRPGDAGFPCGVDITEEIYCFSLLSTASGLVDVTFGQPTRIIRDTTVPGEPIVWFGTSADGSHEQLTANLADFSVRSDSATEPKPAAEFLLSPGIRAQTLPAGPHVANVGTAVITVDLAAEIDEIKVGSDAELEAWLSLRDASASLAFLQATGLMAPETPQANGAVFDRSNHLAEPPTTVEAFDDWMRAMFAVQASGATELGGLPASWWDYVVDDTVDTDTCMFNSPHDGADCREWRFGNFGWTSDSEQQYRIWFVPDAALIVYVASGFEAFDDQLDLVEPVLASLTIEPIG